VSDTYPRRASVRLLISPSIGWTKTSASK
jgi:hypothetical protein